MLPASSLWSMVALRRGKKTEVKSQRTEVRKQKLGYSLFRDLVVKIVNDLWLKKNLLSLL
jgi:hypothetical protein